MLGMQYKIKFNKDFNMDSIRDRVKHNGFKTDGFLDLMTKLDLIVDDQDVKMYAPLYLWKYHEGMNKFIFDGFFDNILNSFGWTHINHMVPLEYDLDKVIETKFVLEIESKIDETNTLRCPMNMFSFENQIGYIYYYNPNTWTYHQFFLLNH